MFGPLKHFLKKKLFEQQKKNQKEIKKEDFEEFFQKPMKKSFSFNNIVAGFRKCGIHPFDPSQVMESGAVKVDIDLYSASEKFKYNLPTWEAREYLSVINRYGLDSHVMIPQLEEKNLLRRQLQRTIQKPFVVLEKHREKKKQKEKEKEEEKEITNGDIQLVEDFMSKNENFFESQKYFSFLLFFFFFFFCCC